MVKQRITVLVFLVLVSMTFGCQRKTEYTADGQEIIKLKLGHIVRPGSPVFDAAEKLAADVAERSGGSIVINIYGSSLLGSQVDLLEGLQIDTVDLLGGEK